MQKLGHIVPLLLLAAWVESVCSCQTPDDTQTQLATGSVNTRPVAAPPTQPEARLPDPPLQPTAPELNPIITPVSRIDPPSDPAGLPLDWPAAQGFAGPAPNGWSGYTCTDDAKGNWVCVLKLNAQLNPGPCTFTADGDLVAAVQSVWSTTVASLLVTRFASAGKQIWTRIWNRSGGFPTHTIDARQLVAHADGRIALAGRDCVRNSQAPRADNPGYYAGSCIDGYVATLDAAGELQWQLHIGTSDGIDYASDVAIGPDGGLYVGGGFQAPLVVPGLQPPAAFGGVDFYVLALDAKGGGRWSRSFGTSQHEGDGVRLSVSRSGDVAVTGNFQANSTAGFAAVLDAQGAQRWRSDVPVHAVGTSASIDDTLLLAGDGSLLAFDPAGKLSTRTAAGSTSASRLASTDHGNVLIYTPGLALSEQTTTGEVLHQVRLGDASQPYYHGAVCSGPSGRLAVTGTAQAASDFGFLAEPMQDVAGAAFILHLAAWESSEAR